MPSDDKMGSLDRDMAEGAEGLEGKGKEKTRNSKFGHYRTQTQSLQIN